MRTFLGLLMVLIVSGDEVTRKGVLGESVLLPCNCPKRDLDREFKWQINETLVFFYNRTTSNFDDKYKERAKIFLPENNNNCSLLLTNTTAEDREKYRCSFYSGGVYTKEFVNLNLSARYNVCQKAVDNLSKVKVQNISTIFNSACTGSHEGHMEVPDRDRYWSFIIFPIMLVIGLSLFLKYRRNFSRSLTRKREEETDSFC